MRAHAHTCSWVCLPGWEVGINLHALLLELWKNRLPKNSIFMRTQMCTRRKYRDLELICLWYPTCSMRSLGLVFGTSVLEPLSYPQSYASFPSHFHSSVNILHWLIPGSRKRQPGFEFWLSHLLATWPWESNNWKIVFKKEKLKEIVQSLRAQVNEGLVMRRFKEWKTKRI